MPQPPILPVIDWKAVFASGLDFEAWINGAANPAKRDAMIDALGRLSIAPHHAAFLKALPRDVHAVAIAEDWCGDVVRHVPVLEKLARCSERLAVRYVSREEHRDVFVRFLTNGGEAIPKFVFLSGDFVECANWGPMPADCREPIARGKACGNVGAARTKVSALYAADPGCAVVIRELMACVDIAASEGV
ncbi:MAG: thioredoxin family protein [Candidatus Hydrogenedentes bacterium]|nr:thioredoxin family protein [Candidatus Hydrogenedentota bacterium]